MFASGKRNGVSSKSEIHPSRSCGKELHVRKNCLMVNKTTSLDVECRIDLNNVIKVADFGLTEDIYARNYFRQVSTQEDGDVPVKLPVKWMALESLNDGVFSEKTDVV